MGFTVKFFAVEPPDKQFEKMKAAWDACQVAGVDIPLEVVEYFGDEDPEDFKGASVEIPDKALDVYYSGYDETHTIDLSELPENTKYIKVNIS